MKKFLSGLWLTLALLVSIGHIDCKKNYTLAPGSFSTQTFTPTRTPSSLATSTPTRTPSPIPTYYSTTRPYSPLADLTSHINGSPVTGNTTGHANHFSYNSWGTLSPDDLYKFTLSTATTLTASLCGSSFDTVLYLRNNCGDSTAITSSDDYCSTSSQITVTLQPGTYYLIVDGYGSSISNYGQYVLKLWTGGVPTSTPTVIASPTSSPTPTASPVATCNYQGLFTPMTPVYETEANNSFATANSLGSTSSTSSYTIYGYGQLNASTDPGDYYVFNYNPSSSPNFLGVFMDCYDNGTQAFDFTLYNSSHTAVTVTSSQGNPNMAHSYVINSGTYYLRFYSTSGSGPYSFFLY